MSMPSCEIHKVIEQQGFVISVECVKTNVLVLKRASLLYSFILGTYGQFAEYVHRTNVELSDNVCFYVMCSVPTVMSLKSAHVNMPAEK